MLKPFKVKDPIKAHTGRLGREKYKVATGKKAAPSIDKAAHRIGNEHYKLVTKSKVMRL